MSRYTIPGKFKLKNIIKSVKGNRKTNPKNSSQSQTPESKSTSNKDNIATQIKQKVLGSEREQKKREEEEQKRRAKQQKWLEERWREDEQKRRAEHQKWLEGEQKKREEEEQKRKAEQQNRGVEKWIVEEQKRMAEQQKWREEEQKRNEEEEKKRAEEKEQKWREEQQKWKAKQQKWKEEEQKRKEEEERKREEEEIAKKKEEERKRKEEDEKKGWLTLQYNKIVEKGLLGAVNSFQNKHGYDLSSIINDQYIDSLSHGVIHKCAIEFNILKSVIEKEGISTKSPEIDYILRRACCEEAYEELNFINSETKHTLGHYLLLMWQFCLVNGDYDLRSICYALRNNEFCPRLDCIYIDTFRKFREEMIKIYEVYNQYIGGATTSEELDNYAYYSNTLTHTYNLPPNHEECNHNNSKYKYDSNNTCDSGFTSRDFILNGDYILDRGLVMRSLLFYIKFKELGLFTVDGKHNTQVLEDGLSNMNTIFSSEIETELLSGVRTENERDKFSLTIDDIDQMDGYSFEEFLVHLYVEMGYRVEHTKLSGDQGADLIISKNGESYVVQAKKHSKKINNKAVQEVTAAIKYYHADGGIVVTNSEFTDSAILLAYPNDISLIGREKLIRLLEKYPVKKEE